MAQTLISRGFGALQRIITRGFFSAAPPSPDCFVAFQGQITPSEGFEGEIELNLAVVGIINDADTAVIGAIYPVARFEGIIDPRDTGFNGTITDKDGFIGKMCDC